MALVLLSYPIPSLKIRRQDMALQKTNKSRKWITDEMYISASRSEDKTDWLSQSYQREEEEEMDML